MKQLRKHIVTLFIVLGLTCSCVSADRIQLSPHVTLIQDAVNGVVIEKDDHKLIIYGDPTTRIQKADIVLFTHHRRDIVWAGRSLAEKDVEVIAPAAEIEKFTKVTEFWSDFTQKRFHDYQQQGTKIITRPLRVDRQVKQGDTIDWQDLKIQVFDTPGYTRGAVSYLMEIDDTKYAFVGDLIYGDGKLFDLYSLQNAVPEAKIGGYHGWAGRLGDLLQSLRKVREQKPDILIPARGPAIKNPNQAIDRLIPRIQAVYANYLSINAGHWYFKERYDVLAKRVLGSPDKVDWMPYAVKIQKQPPDWIIPIQNTRLIVANDKTGFLVDCGSRGIIQEIKKLLDKGTITKLEGLFITHYHDDHTDKVFELIRDLKCPVYATRQSADILLHPSAYRLPAMTANPIPNLQILPDGHKMRWKEFNFTFYYYPGQTIYHDALLAEKDNGGKIFFLGDSFTPSGIDDYCLLNRNILQEGMGYFYCLDLLDTKIPQQSFLINQHVLEPFQYNQQQRDRMRNTLRQRKKLLAELFPWPEPNFGIDERWARCYPYGQTAKPGQTVQVEVKIFNHLDSAQIYIIKPNVPENIQVQPQRFSIKIPPRKETGAVFQMTFPENENHKVYVPTFDIAFNQWDLHQWCEALIEIEQ
jgi:glyoxylase-like metal-dependent hydrolase (beta-lactamase superfamily II)